jgi:hypothetical protein
MADPSSPHVTNRTRTVSRGKLRLNRPRPEVWELGLVALAEVIRADSMSMSFRAKYSETSGRPDSSEGRQAS